MEKSITVDEVNDQIDILSGLYNNVKHCAFRNDYEGAHTYEDKLSKESMLLIVSVAKSNEIVDAMKILYIKTIANISISTSSVKFTRYCA